MLDLIFDIKKLHFRQNLTKLILCCPEEISDVEENGI